jgi:hypothetical protein
MPTYQNGTGETISWNGETWAPGETKAANFFVPDEIGLALADASPKAYGPTLAGGALGLSGELPGYRLYVPDCNAFVATFVCTEGAADIRENYADAPVAIEVSQAAGFEGAYSRAAVECFYLKANVGYAYAAVSYSISRRD